MVTLAASEPLEHEDHELLVRNERGAKNRGRFRFHGEDGETANAEKLDTDFFRLSYG